ncbi:hypothetical protein QC762_311140 [Podospora pseudocomata]|uniref:Ankyrin repeat protein n=1 Tax=Podospora pseudocomata TaxID=2093779 RepID=A0ABR0GKV4_9PEZI|nr:hypothetical protein QC762_311140 [Podospora pseudocomata]
MAKYGARLELKDETKQTPLLLACGYERIVGLLLCHGADPTTFNDAGETPYSLASHHMRGIFHRYAYNGRYNLAMLRTEN